MAPPPQGITMKISGYDVQFPFKPYASQLVRAARYTSLASSTFVAPLVPLNPSLTR
jgi:hypothetical protein